MFRKLLRFIVIIACGLFFFIGITRIAIIVFTRPQLTSIAEAQPKETVIVPGAGLNRNNTPSTPLRDRIDTAIALYQAGKVSQILMSGDNISSDYYDEPEAMRQYALSMGIPDEDILIDHAGARTYDTCYRAKNVFNQEDVYFVTQSYHLSRALFLCRELGLKTEGIPVEQSYYARSRYLFWNFREIFATLAAVWDIYVAKPLPLITTP